MNELALQVFLTILVFGGLFILLFFLFRNFFMPRKISVLKNQIKNENYKNAISLAKDILSRDKNNIEAHFYLAEAYYNQGKNELALIEYKIVEKSGNYHDIEEKKLRERLGELFMKINDLDEALKEYVLLIKNYPDEYLYYYFAGQLFEKKELVTQAIKFYANSIKLNQSYIPALQNLGILLFNNKNYSEADKYLQTAVNKEPNNYKGFFYLGLIKKVENNYKVALKYFEQSIKDKELRVRSFMERGIVYMMQRRFDEAIIELDRALKSNEEEDNVKLNIRYVLASCYEQNRNITEAISLWEEIYAIKPNFRDVSEKLSNYQELRVDDRMKDFLTATDIDFIDICKSIVNKMGLNISEMEVISNDIIEFLCLESDDKWRNVKKRPKLILISRSNDPIEELILRKLQDKMKDKGVIRGVVITSSVYTKLAIYFAKERPIELIDKNGLQEILKGTSI